MIKITPPSTETSENNPSVALLQLGFRIFFLAAGVTAIIYMLLWLWVLSGHTLDNYYGGLFWHRHEMLFGYTGAVIAGFLLTAMQNWSGMRSLHGFPLLALFGLWLAGRLLAFMPGVPVWLVMGVDVAFFPVLAVILLIPLIKCKLWTQLVFIPLLLLLFLANLLVHLEVNGILADSAKAGNDLGLGLIVLLLVIMAGRVVPFFTRMALPAVDPKQFSWLDKLAILPVILLVFLPVLSISSRILALVYLWAALANAARIFYWYSWKVLSVPLLWILHGAAWWLVIGFFLLAWHSWYGLPLTTPLHALTVGGIACMTLGMMARVSLGHTGRKMKAHILVVVAFGLLLLATALRVFLPAFDPQYYMLSIGFSGGLWLLAFVLFTGVYGVILCLPRIDGREG